MNSGLSYYNPINNSLTGNLNSLSQIKINALLFGPEYEYFPRNDVQQDLLHYLYTNDTELDKGMIDERETS